MRSCNECSNLYVLLILFLCTYKLTEMAMRSIFLLRRSFSISDCLKNEEFQKVLDFFVPSNLNDIEESSEIIVSIATSHLTLENEKNNKYLFECCKKVLDRLVEMCNPSELVLELLEYTEYENGDDTRFCEILKPLAKILQKLRKKSLAIGWCTCTIKSYSDSLPIPENENRILNKKDSCKQIDPATRRIINIYLVVLQFVDPFVKETSLKHANEIDLKEFRANIMNLLLFLFGQPFSHIDPIILMSSTNNDLIIIKRHLSYICKLTGNVMQYLNIAVLKARGLNRTKKEKAIAEDDITEFEEENYTLRVTDTIPTLAFANFYFFIITSYWEIVPQIYYPNYIFTSSLYFIKKFLQSEENVLLHKAFIFMEHIFSLVEKHFINVQMLEIKIYTELLVSINNIMIFCQHEKHRNNALIIFRSYMELFNMEARYYVLKYLYEVSHHSGLLSLLTGIFKSSIIECLDTSPPIPYFLGNNLKYLLRKACSLPHGSESDLVEISDEVITSLNLIRFLILKDSDNKTGIWDMIPELERNYLEQIEAGIRLCQGAWKGKLHELEQEKKSNEFKPLDKRVSLIVGGEQLPPMPVAQKFQIVLQALSGLDVMESILFRVKECIRFIATSRSLNVDTPDSSNSQSTTTEHKNESDKEYEENIKTKILTASLKYVNDFGWSQEAISAGAESVGYPGIIHGMFQKGGAELVQYFYACCNSELNKIMKEEAERMKENFSDEKKPTEVQIRDAVEIRLRMLIPYKNTWPQALALMSLPHNVPTFLANLLTLSDDICYYAGDRSVDFDWYTRRVILAGIYKATELYMLQDNSEDHMQTWKFLERRIDDASQIHAVFSATTDILPSDETFKRASAAFVTARNILGLSWNR
ncbi:glomulin-like [Prorops nasuta]|uniref:glomulin-like n=1 Tax=Prorops nasuta TaxID=863751 RepID=UPI0034CF2FBC